MFGGHCSAFDQRQQIALNALAGNRTTLATVLDGNFVDLVKKDDAILFDRFQSSFCNRFIVQKLVSLFCNQSVIAI